MYGLREFLMGNNTFLKEHIILHFWQTPMNPKATSGSGMFCHGEKDVTQDGPSTLHGADKLIPKHHQIPQGA